MYCIDDRKSFENIENWLQLIRQKAGPSISIILLGAHLENEMNRLVSYEEGKSMADKHQIEFYEVSAKKDINVTESFQRITDKIVDTIYKDEISGQPIRKPITVHSVKHFFIQKTGKEIGDLLFDSMKDNWKIKTSVFHEKVINQQCILIVISTETNHIGCYIESPIVKIGKYNEDSNCFIFNLQTEQSFSIKTSKYANCIYSSTDEKLISIGKEDIVIFKEERKEKSYCKQSSFDYQNQSNVLVGMEGKNHPFIVKRIIVFQMI